MQVLFFSKDLFKFVLILRFEAIAECIQYLKYILQYGISIMKM